MTSAIEPKTVEYSEVTGVNTFTSTPLTTKEDLHYCVCALETIHRYSFKHLQSDISSDVILSCERMTQVAQAKSILTLVNDVILASKNITREYTEKRCSSCLRTTLQSLLMRVSDLLKDLSESSKDSTDSFSSVDMHRTCNAMTHVQTYIKTILAHTASKRAAHLQIEPEQCKKTRIDNPI